jgi:hypothetical protein
MSLFAGAVRVAPEMEAPPTASQETNLPNPPISGSAVTTILLGLVFVGTVVDGDVHGAPTTEEIGVVPTITSFVLREKA